MADKSYDILRVYFQFRIGRFHVQLRRLWMHSQPSGISTVFTISTAARPQN